MPRELGDLNFLLVDLASWAKEFRWTYGALRMYLSEEAPLAEGAEDWSEQIALIREDQ